MTDEEKKDLIDRALLLAQMGNFDVYTEIEGGIYHYSGALLCELKEELP